MVGEGKKSRYTPIKLRERKKPWFFILLHEDGNLTMESTFYFCTQGCSGLKKPYQIFDLLDKNLDCRSGCKDYLFQ